VGKGFDKGRQDREKGIGQRQTSEGLFSRERYLEVVVDFDDRTVLVSFKTGGKDNSKKWKGYSVY